MARKGIMMEHASFVGFKIETNEKFGDTLNVTYTNLPDLEKAGPFDDLVIRSRMLPLDTELSDYYEDAQIETIFTRQRNFEPVFGQIVHPIGEVTNNDHVRESVAILDSFGVPTIIYRLEMDNAGGWKITQWTPRKFSEGFILPISYQVSPIPIRQGDSATCHGTWLTKVLAGVTENQVQESIATVQEELQIFHCQEIIRLRFSFPRLPDQIIAKRLGLHARQVKAQLKSEHYPSRCIVVLKSRVMDSAIVNFVRNAEYNGSNPVEDLSARMEIKLEEAELILDREKEVQKGLWLSIAQKGSDCVIIDVDKHLQEGV